MQLAITWANADILSITQLRMYFCKILIQIQNVFIFQENASENIVCKTAAILSRLQCEKYNKHRQRCCQVGERRFGEIWKLNMNFLEKSCFFRIFLGIPEDWTGRQQKITCSGHVDGLVQERRNSSALAMELRLSCTNSLM